MRAAFILLVVLLSYSANAQKMLWSTPQKITNRNYYTQILGQNSSGIYYYQTSKSNQSQNIQLIALDANMKSKARKEFLTASKERLQRMVLLDNSLIIFYTIHDRKMGVISLWAKHLSPDLNEIVEDKKVSSVASTDFKSDAFRILASRRRDEILVAASANNDSTAANINVKVYNYALKNIRSSQLNQPNSLLRRSEFINGVWFSVKTNVKKAGLFKKRIERILIKHNTRTSETQEIPLFGEGWNSLTGLFTYSPRDSTYVFSSYFYEEDSTQPAGFLQLNVSTTKDTLSKAKTPYPTKMLEDLFGKGARKKQTNQLRLVKAIKRSDGGTVFISEKTEVDEQIIQDVSLYGIQQNYTRLYYYFYDISIASIDPNGELDWHQKVKKEQISLNDDGYYSSFGCEVSKNRLYFIFNDLSRKSGNLMIYAMKPDGTNKGEILINGKEFDGYAIPKESMQLSSSSLLVPMIKPREGFTLLKLEF